jgi:hypothetical protein
MPCRRLTLRAGWLNQVFTQICHFFLKCWFGTSLLCFVMTTTTPLVASVYVPGAVVAPAAQRTVGQPATPV